MDKFRLQLKIDSENERQRGDDAVVEGLVSVEAFEGLECRSLTVEASWYVYGWDEEHRQAEVTEQIYEGDWDTGREYSYRFRLDLPPGPYTYRGEAIEIDWLVEVTAVLATGETRKVRRSFSYPPDFNRQTYRVGDSAAIPPKLAHSKNLSIIEQVRQKLGVNLRRWKLFVMVAAALQALAIASGLLLGGVVVSGKPKFLEYLLSSPASMIAVSVGLLITVGVMAVSTYYAKIQFQEYWNGIVLTKPRFEIGTSRVSPSGTIECEFWLPRHLAPAETISANLLGDEKAKKIKGDTIEYESVSICTAEEMVEAGEGQYREKVNAYKYQFEFHIPEDAPLSFFAPTHSIEWELELAARLSAENHWIDTEPFWVIPPDTEVLNRP